MVDNTKLLKKINAQARKKINDSKKKEQAEINKQTEQQELF